MGYSSADIGLANNYAELVNESMSDLMKMQKQINRETDQNLDSVSPSVKDPYIYTQFREKAETGRGSAAQDTIVYQIQSIIQDQKLLKMQNENIMGVLNLLHSFN